jgi:16S rRNA (cytosine1407-C5)-methyltransferase
MWRDDRLEPLIRLQRRLLARACELLAPGGGIIYSTCTTNREENEDQVAWAVRECGLSPGRIEPLPGFAWEDPGRDEAAGSLRVNGPGSGSQSFFLARLDKTGEMGPLSDGPGRGRVDVEPGLHSEGIAWENLPSGEVRTENGRAVFRPEQGLRILPRSFRWRGFILGRAGEPGLVPAPRARLLLPDAEEARDLVVTEPETLHRLLSGQSTETVAGDAKRVGLYWYDLPLGWLTAKKGRVLWSDRY